MHTNTLAWLTITCGPGCRYRVARNALPTLRRIGFGGILTLTSNDKAALSSNGAALLVWVLAGVLMISGVVTLCTVGVCMRWHL